MQIKIDIQNQALQHSLSKLQHRISDMSSFFQELGVELEQQAHERFATSTAPDGSPWQANTEATIISYIYKKSGHYKEEENGKKKMKRTGTQSGYYRKDGRIGSKGVQAAINKKPLTGISQSLKKVYYQIEGQSVFVGTNAIYGAMQQFGGTKSQFPKLWGDIPARPFLPIKPDGSLYESAQQLIMTQLENYINKD